jgi:hypothetical protein
MPARSEKMVDETVHNKAEVIYDVAVIFIDRLLRRGGGEKKLHHSVYRFML